MAKQKHVINLSEVAVDRINAPEGSPFGGLRQRVGTHIGAQKLAEKTKVLLHDFSA